MTNQKGRSSRNYSRVRDRYGDACLYCGAPADSIDHLAPWSYAPDNSMANMVPSCMPCNLAAGALVFPTFGDKRAYILARRGIGPSVAPSEPESVPEPLDTGERVSAYLAARERARRTVIPTWKQRDYRERKPARTGRECGKPTSAGTPCRLDAGTCPYHL